jgi:chemotaxis protein methyltransferase CheR
VSIESNIAKVSELIERKLGLNFPENRLQDLKKIIQSALPELGFGKSFESFFQAICADSLSQVQYDILATHLTIGETYFFRDALSLQALKNIILPQLIEKRSENKREIRIWSAGCCTGEEVYTLAILLSELLSDIESWNITILGSDINRKFIQKAINGRYTQWSFRVTPMEVLNRYFTKVGREFEIIPRIKKMVTFSYINLADDKYPSRSTNTDAMDIILCRNVLMYFSAEHRDAVVNRFTQSLVPNGWLITSPVEMANEDISKLTRVILDDAILYRKGSWHDENPTIAFSSSKVAEPIIKVENQSDPLLFRTDDAPIPCIHQKVAFQEYAVPSNFEQPEVSEIESVNENITDLQEAKKFYKQGLYEEALALFKKSYHQNPNDNSAIYFLAKTSANLGYHTEALLWCEKLIDSDTMNANYHYLWATILLELNEIDQAEKILKKVLYLDSKHILTHFVMGNNFRNHGKIKMAKKHYQNVMDILESFQDDSIIPESDGLTVASMKEMIEGFI